MCGLTPCRASWIAVWACGCRILPAADFVLPILAQSRCRVRQGRTRTASSSCGLNWGLLGRASRSLRHSSVRGRSHPRTHRIGRPVMSNSMSNGPQIGVLKNCGAASNPQVSPPAPASACESHLLAGAGGEISGLRRGRQVAIAGCGAGPKRLRARRTRPRDRARIGGTQLSRWPGRSTRGCELQATDRVAAAAFAPPRSR